MPTTRNTSPTIILVHGAWADGSSWHEVATLLMRMDYRVVAAQLPLSSFRDDVEALRQWIRRQSDPVVLVGHSYGGAVITAAAAGEPNVKSLVYVAAIVPDTGETVGQVFTRMPPHAMAPTLQPDSNGYIWMSEEGFRAAVAPNVSSEDATWMTATQKPISVKCLSEPVEHAGWRELPSWFLIAEEDRMVSPDTQRFTASRMRSVVVSRAVDHHPLASDPRAVSDLIDQAARA